jgi:hypothetical protein
MVPRGCVPPLATLSKAFQLDAILAPIYDSQFAELGALFQAAVFGAGAVEPISQCVFGNIKATGGASDSRSFDAVHTLEPSLSLAFQFPSISLSFVHREIWKWGKN